MARLVDCCLCAVFFFALPSAGVTTVFRFHYRLFDCHFLCSGSTLSFTLDQWKDSRAALHCALIDEIWKCWKKSEKSFQQWVSIRAPQWTLKIYIQYSIRNETDLLLRIITNNWKFWCLFQSVSTWARELLSELDQSMLACWLSIVQKKKHNRKNCQRLGFFASLLRASWAFRKRHNSTSSAIAVLLLRFTFFFPLRARA